jgi:hypothetical protein
LRTWLWVGIGSFDSKVFESVYKLLQILNLDLEFSTLELDFLSLTFINIAIVLDKVLQRLELRLKFTQLAAEVLFPRILHSNLLDHFVALFDLRVHIELKLIQIVPQSCVVSEKLVQLALCHKLVVLVDLDLLSYTLEPRINLRVRMLVQLIKNVNFHDLNLLVDVLKLRSVNFTF